MLFSIDQLLDKYKNHANPYQKIGLEVKNGRLIKLKRGLYTDSLKNKFYVANAICSPSYISFESALSYYGLIPERVVNVINASFGKNKTKSYDVGDCEYIYYSIPKTAFVEGYELIKIDDLFVKIASPAKALCDRLTLYHPIKTQKEMEYVLFEDLRIDKDLFEKRIDLGELLFLCPFYRRTSLYTLAKFVERYLNVRRIRDPARRERNQKK